MDDETDRTSDNRNPLGVPCACSPPGRAACRGLPAGVTIGRLIGRHIDCVPVQASMPVDRPSPGASRRPPRSWLRSAIALAGSGLLCLLSESRAAIGQGVPEPAQAEPSLAALGFTDHVRVEVRSVPIDPAERASRRTGSSLQTSQSQVPPAATNTGPPREQPDWRTLTFSSGAFTPQPGIDPRLEASLPGLRAAGRETVYGFISLTPPVTATLREELTRLGVTLLDPYDAMHMARLPVTAEALAEIVNLSLVEWIGFSTLEQKTSSGLDALLPGVAAGARDDFPADDLDLVVSLFDDDAEGTFRRAIERTGAVVRHAHPRLRAYSVTASPAQIAVLTRLDFVLFVEPDQTVTPQHDTTMALIDAAWGRGEGHDGSGVRVGVADTGFDFQHSDLLREDWCAQDFVNSVNLATRDPDGHGTHVLGTIMGTGRRRARYRGVAPDARPIVARIFDDKGKGRSSATIRAMAWMAKGCDDPPLSPLGSFVTGPAWVVNLSIGPENLTAENRLGINASARAVDAHVYYDRQAYVVAAGNKGIEGLGGVGASKNAITVGNVTADAGLWGLQVDAGRLNEGSGRGPTSDGRMKPNLVAPGTSVASTAARSGDGYESRTGTSMAAPHVSGLVATLMEHYPEEFVGKPALLRAWLMATSIQRPGGPTAKYGLGRVSSRLAHWDKRGAGGWHGFREGGETVRSHEASMAFQVPADAERLVVVATWNEPPARAGASRAVLYNYDLWLDNLGTSTRDRCGASCGEWASESTVDNVEYIIIDHPGAGRYEAKPAVRDRGVRHPGEPAPASGVSSAGRTAGGQAAARRTLSDRNPRGHPLVRRVGGDGRAAGHARRLAARRHVHQPVRFGDQVSGNGTPGDEPLFGKCAGTDRRLVDVQAAKRGDPLVSIPCVVGKLLRRSCCRDIDTVPADVRSRGGRRRAVARPGRGGDRDQPGTDTRRVVRSQHNGSKRWGRPGGIGWTLGALLSVR